MIDTAKQAPSTGGKNFIGDAFEAGELSVMFGNVHVQITRQPEGLKIDDNEIYMEPLSVPKARMRDELETAIQTLISSADQNNVGIWVHALPAHDKIETPDGKTALSTFYTGHGFKKAFGQPELYFREPKPDQAPSRKAETRAPGL